MSKRKNTDVVEYFSESLNEIVFTAKAKTIDSLSVYEEYSREQLICDLVDQKRLNEELTIRNKYLDAEYSAASENIISLQNLCCSSNREISALRRELNEVKQQLIQARQGIKRSK
jgi:hypothetical protein